MDEFQGCPVVQYQDLRAALREMKVYVDVTEEDLKKIYDIALGHAKDRLLSKRTVSSAMKAQVVTVRKDTGRDEAAHLMSENRISGMPVVDAEGRVVGVVSEADILCMAGLKEGHTFRDVLKHLLGEPLHTHKVGDKVEDIMSAPAITIGPDADIRDASAILTEKRIKRLPVVAESGKLIGIISRGDIVRSLGER